MGAERILVLGGTRSGKSRYARERALALGGDTVTFVATARTGDAELDQRIALHRADRPAPWTTVEVDADLAGAIERADPHHVLLIDSLTLWAATVVEREGSLRARTDALVASLAPREGAVILVSDEVGMGIVPANALARAFIDELGWLEQTIASLCGEVFLMVAGIPITVKPSR